MQQERRAQCVIVVQPVEWRILERAERFRNRVRQSIRSTEDRIAVGIGGFGSLPEETQLSLVANELIHLDGRYFRDSRSDVWIDVVLRDSVSKRSVRRRKQGLNLDRDRVPAIS